LCGGCGISQAAAQGRWRSLFKMVPVEGRLPLLLLLQLVVVAAALLLLLLLLLLLELGVLLQERAARIGARG
jgi:hypothetical protein